MNALGTVVAFVRGVRGNAFSPRDLAELQRWAGESRRVALHEDRDDVFALLYEGALPWASWGVSRQSGKVLLWDCVSLADLGRFPSVAEALAILPGETAPGPLSNVVSFDPLRRRAV